MSATPAVGVHPVTSRGPDVTQVCAPEIKTVAQRVSWMKVIVLAAVGLIAAGATVAAFAAQYATQSDVSQAVGQHADTDGHPALRRDIRDVQDRLIRIELTTGTMRDTQERMDRKLDGLIERMTVPAWQVPRTPAPPNPSGIIP